MIEFRDHDAIDSMAEAVAAEIVAIVAAAIAAKGEALLAFPGGSTPRPIFARLLASPLPWQNLIIFPGDDRLVPIDSPLSNFRELDAMFAGTGARLVDLTCAASDYHAAGDAADAKLQTLRWPPDLVWLGMGMDGHTASIFPGPDLESALDSPPSRRAVGVLPDPLPREAPVARVSLTRPAIRSAQSIAITLRGSDKRDLIERAIAEGPSSQFPVGRVLAGAEAPVRIHCCP